MKKKKKMVGDKFRTQESESLPAYETYGIQEGQGTNQSNSFSHFHPHVCLSKFLGNSIRFIRSLGRFSHIYMSFCHTLHCFSLYPSILFCLYKYFLNILQILITSSPKLLSYNNKHTHIYIYIYKLYSIVSFFNI